MTKAEIIEQLVMIPSAHKTGKHVNSGVQGFPSDHVALVRDPHKMADRQSLPASR